MTSSPLSINPDMDINIASVKPIVITKLLSVEICRSNKVL